LVLFTAPVLADDTEQIDGALKAETTNLQVDFCPTANQSNKPAITTTIRANPIHTDRLAPGRIRQCETISIRPTSRRMVKYLSQYPFCFTSSTFSRMRRDSASSCASNAPKPATKKTEGCRANQTQNYDCCRLHTLRCKKAFRSLVLR
jgi:hypothetical protein